MKKTSKKTPKKLNKILQQVQPKKDLTSVYIAILATVVIIVVFFLAYLSKMSKLPNDMGSSNGTNGQQVATLTILPTGSSQQVKSSTQNQIQANMNMVENSGSIPANGRVKFKIDQFKKLALQPLDFQVFDENGKAYTQADLQVENEQPMHLIIVSSDLKEFQHLHPSYQNGSWKVLANLPNVGTYYTYVDITPVKGPHVVLRSNLVVQKDTTGTINYPGLTQNMTVTNKTFTAQLTLSQALILQQSTLSYKVMNNGKPATLSPYLGALGHLVIFRQGNVDSYTHVHPLSTSNAQNGLAEFMTTFVKGGRYTAFAEFKLGNTVYTFPITFDISG